MQLMMYIGNDLIETINVDIARLSIPGYLGGYKRQLKQKYRELLLESAEQAEFLVINMAPVNSNNKTRSLSSTSSAISASYF